MFQKKTFVVSAVDNSDAQVYSAKKLSDVEAATQMVSRRSLVKHAGMLGLIGGMALIVVACSDGGSSGSNGPENGIPTSTTNDPSGNSGSSSSGSSGSDDDNGDDDNGSGSSGSSGSDDGSDDGGSSGSDDGDE